MCDIYMLKTYHSRDNNTVGVGTCKAFGNISLNTATCQDTSGMGNVCSLETLVKIRVSNSEVVNSIDSRPS